TVFTASNGGRERSQDQGRQVARHEELPDARCPVRATRRGVVGAGGGRVIETPRLCDSRARLTGRNGVRHGGCCWEWIGCVLLSPIEPPQTRGRCYRNGTQRTQDLPRPH